RIPLITHDSDAMPGLANRLVSGRAVLHATALPASQYPAYQASKIHQVGVIVGPEYQLMTPQLQVGSKRKLSLPGDSPLLMITGGSLGAKSINQAMAKIVPELLTHNAQLQIVHQVGRGHLDCYGSFSSNRLKVADLLPNLEVYLGAADLVVTRAGANTLAELGVLAKAAIVVPNPHLTGGHQLKNAQYLADQDAVEMVDDEQLNTLAGQQQLNDRVNELLASAERRQKLAYNFHQATILDGAQQLAKLILLAAKPAPTEEKA
ncbi:MAG: glycosyltransferase, partial [Candidatus Saccharimonadales bacterium]